MPCSTHAVSLTPARQPGHPMFKRMYRRRAPLLALALTALSLTALVRPDGSFRLQIDSSPSAIGAAESQADFSVFAGITFDGSVRAIDIAEIAQLEARLLRMHGVLSAEPIATTQTPQSVDDDIEVKSLYHRQLDSPERAEALWQAAQDDPLNRGRLLSADNRTIALVVDARGDTPLARQAIATTLRQVIVDAFAHRTDVGVNMTSAPLISASIGGLLIRQLGIVLPVAMIGFAMLIWLSFRSWPLILVSLVAVAAANLWTLAALVMFGWSLNLVTIIIPPLVMALCVANVTHVLAACSDNGQIEDSLRELRLPMLLTIITTTIGLLALAVTDLVSIQQFAILGAIGAMASGFAAWTFVPAAIRLFQIQPTMWPPMESRLVAGANRVAAFVIAHDKTVVRTGVVALVVLTIGALLVEPGARYIRDLPRTHPERQAYESISALFGGANTFQIDIEGAGQDAILLPEILSAVDRLQTWLEARPDVGSAISLPDYVKSIHQALQSGEPAQWKIPDDSSLIKQMMIIAAPRDIYQYTDLNFSRLHIRINTPVVETQALRQLFNEIEHELASFPPGLNPTLSGNAVQLTSTIESLTGGQIRSLSLAAVAIFIVLALLFTSVKVALMAMLPNLLPVIAYFALLGFTGTPLGPTTALVACIVLGIAVDDTLHLLVRFNQRARACGNERQASRESIAQVIRPITLTTAAVSLGFLTMLSSPFHSQAVFGLLSAVTLVLAWASDLLLAPAVSARASIVTLWDVMRIDLGADPQQTIPFMQGMSNRQARLLALAGEFRTLKAGQMLTYKGEERRELYVIIDGEFDAWLIRRAGERVDLARLTRGACIGESGLFMQRRTANVSARTNSRVLVIKLDALERLRRRHSKVSALAYRNLNLIQAERMARTTDRVYDGS